MRRSLLAAACVAALAGGVAGQARAAAYTFTTIDAPDISPPQFSATSSATTTPGGINDQGQVVGTVIYATGFLGGYTTSSAGFLYSSGNFTSIPGLSNVIGIDDNGQILGQNQGTNFVETNGVLAALPQIPPNSPIGYGPLGFRPTSLNDSGTVLGYGPILTGSGSTAGYTYESFLYDSGTFTTLAIADPSGQGTLSANVIATGINDSGEIVGTGPAQSFGFLENAGATTLISLYPGLGVTVPTAISNSGLITGYEGEAAFVDDNGAFTLLGLPAAGAFNVMPTGINDAGDVVGTYMDANDINHAFLATPVAVPEPAPAALLGTGLAGLALALRQRRRGA